MKNNEVFKLVQNQIMEKDLVPFSSEVYEDIKSQGLISCEYEEAIQIMIDNELDIKNLYFLKNSLSSLWYVDKYAFVEIYGLSDDFFKLIPIKEVVTQTNNKLTAFIKEGKYVKFFGLIHQQFAFNMFLKLNNQIPDNQIFDVFKRVYTHSEYGFNDIDKELVRKVFSSNKKKEFKNYIRVDKNGYATIYRGMTDLSTPVEEAYSWTLDFNVAVFFAKRFNTLNSSIYKAKVHIDNIVDFIESRSEKEILLLPENLIDIQNMYVVNFNDCLLEELNKENVIDDYKYFRDNYIDESLFHNPQGIHAKLHTQRVLLLSLIFSYLKDLNNEDRNVLIYASLYHDIGRTDDNEDKSHGMKSLKKMKKYNVAFGDISMSDEDIYITKSIIKNHSISDEVGFKLINEDAKIIDKDRAIRLYKYFKEQDNLDRVRISDLDTKYLRTNTGRRMVVLAHQLLTNIR